MKKYLLLTFILLSHLTLLFGQATRYVSAKKLNLREQPDKAFSVTQTLPQGTKVGSHPLVSVKESETINSYGRRACQIRY